MLLITGGAGYIGSHTNKFLSAKGYSTLVLDNLIYGHLDFVKWGSFVQADLADKAALDNIFGKHPIDAVLHFAAYAYVGESVHSPAKYYQNNVVNTLNLLETMRKHGCNKLVFSSSCATYGVPERMPITEDMPQQPVNPYGRTKYMIEQILRDYGVAYGLRFVSLRYFNAAGADPDGEIGEWHEPETHLIPLVLKAASGERQSIKVFGVDYPTPDGSCIRDYIHVSDLAQAHVLALEYLNNGGESGCFNLGNSRGSSVLEVIEAAKCITGRDFPVEQWLRRSGDPPELVGSGEKARTVLGWKPQYENITTIIRHAWQWECEGLPKIRRK